MQDALLGGAAGSIITIFFTFLGAIILKKLELSNELRKIVLNRKLEVADAASSLYSSLSANYQSLSTLYQHIHESGIKDIQVFVQLNSSLSQYIKNLSEAPINQVASSLPLYFDLGDDQEKDKQLLKDFYDSLCYINTRNNIYIFLEERGSDVTDPEEIRKIQAAKENLIHEILEKLSSFSSLLNEITTRLFIIQKTLRRNIMEYEHKKISICLKSLYRRFISSRNKQELEAGGQAAPRK
jgi:hypothetical protein